MARDFYEVLGIDRSASADDIKRAYRKLSKELHPDKHKGEPEAEKRFQEVNEAYETLSDPKKRQMYDQFGTAGGPGAGGGFGGFNVNPEDLGGFSDIFESFFGGAAGGGARGGSRAQREQRGRDIEVELSIDFTDVVNGAEKTIKIRRLNTCTHCDGQGAEPGSEMKTCNTCGGTGQVTKTAQSFFGVIQQSVICPDCKGAGKRPEKQCSKCSGEGRIAEDARVNVNVPAGIDSGQTLRIRGEGEAGRQGASAGDLFVHIHVQEDPRFTRDGYDIQTEVILPVIDAILGTEITVETVREPVTLKIPAGTQPSQIFRLKGKGLPILNRHSNGDHFVTMHIEVPKKLSGKEKDLMKQWKESLK